MVDKLKEILDYVAWIDFDDWRLWDDLELENKNTGKTVQFENEDEACNYILPNGKSIGEYVDKVKIEISYEGGRGANANTKMGGGFGSSGGDVSEQLYGKTLFPASFNTQGRYTTQEQTIKNFEKKYGNKDIEYAISVDSDGFVYTHQQGGEHSVKINASGKDHMVVHNHPNGSNFSGTDLISITRMKNAEGVIATNLTTNRYTLRKKKNFDAKGFEKAIRKAQWPADMDYNQGADWWLRRNQKKYGYSYSRKKLGKATKAAKNTRPTNEGTKKSLAQAINETRRDINATKNKVEKAYNKVENLG